MSQSNALVVSPKSVIAEIVERLAALKPEQFIEPDMQPDADYRAVGEASDDIKLLFDEVCDLFHLRLEEAYYPAAGHISALLKRIAVFFPVDLLDEA